ncbi:MAG: hypothetical protein COA79_15620 [Planctomycetota bacterium]|nr:MAG: hypothetical protein COA79_15620 [Planctomycetota bacterium]
MKLIYIFLIVAIALLNGCSTNKTSVVKKDVTLIIKEVKFSKEVVISKAVQEECNLKKSLVKFIKKTAAPQYTKVLTNATSDTQNSHILTIEISQVVAGGGGLWSGSKSVMIKGTLTQDGTQLGSFKGFRYSSGGAWGAYKGTCVILNRCVRTLAKDVTQWLANPTVGARIGNLKKTKK